MKLKCLVLGSLVGLVAILSAHATELAAAEPLEHVRVCDAYGTGYFYIPGTETCLSIGGYLRFEARFGRDKSGTSEWDFWQRAQVDFSSKSDTELGTLTGLTTLRHHVESDEDQKFILIEGYIDIAGLRLGKQFSWWDADPSGETDRVTSNATSHNSLRYQYEADDFAAGISIDELVGVDASKPGEGANNFGVASQISGTIGGVTGYLLGSYDTDTEEGAVRAIVYADIGPGQLGIYGVWASGANAYYEESEWTVGAQYVWEVDTKWTLTPGFQYFDNVDLDADGEGFSGDEEWTAGVTIDYQIVKNLASKLSVQYNDNGVDDQVTGFLRLQRDF